MKLAPRSLAALLILGGGVVIASRHGTANAGTPTSGGGFDLSLPDWGSGWDWSFDGSDGTADTPTTWYTEADMQKPRGIRNNNPGNIEYTGTQWQGLDNPASDGRFMRFIAPEWGIRALARTLDTYHNTHGIDTVRGIINRWAPSFENNTGSYIGHVAQSVGVSADQPFDVNAKMPQLVRAIIQHENGEQPYSTALINKGIGMA
jgi:hypothetical protein